MFENCVLPTSVVAGDIKIVKSPVGTMKCDPGQAPITRALLEPIVDAVCHLPDVAPWAICNGDNIALQGSSYSCNIEDGLDPGAGETMCVPCAGGGGGAAGALSGGSIFLIIFVSLCFIYFVGGILYTKFVKKEGFKPLHTEFWADLPALVKDGSMFLVSKVKGGKQDKYEEL